MKMPDKIENDMLAPCGMNCTVCYSHVGMRKYGKKCQGCIHSNVGKPEHCRACSIKACAQSKGYKRCLECNAFPCKLIKNLERSYNKRYKESLVANSLYAGEHSIKDFLDMDRKKRTCPCGGAISLHEGVCSECGKGFPPSINI